MGYVIVTGAAGGIGQALVRAFAEAGYPVIGVDLAAKPERLPTAHYIQCDLARTVAEPTYAEEIFSTIRTTLDGQPFDALINNAAVQILGKVEGLNRDAWHRTLDVNLLAPFLWAQALLPELEEAKGCVLNISSIHARLTKPEFVAYATSKAALSGMTRAMAIELGSRVRVNAIEPAAIDTPMLLAGFNGNPAGYELLKYCHPSRCVGSTDGLARLAVAITQLEDGFANGSIVRFDGGIGAQLHDPRTLYVSCEDSG
ncbi:SDR family NAD(P)-dependent oxidoreductase [Nitrococcus mobilis]|uniref:Probable oxidoreductase n=1 Tax=Nitrococcus mobilis Nb-231 TaxID=314278 RepID=A4BRT2_9GAMM|nr:SDR family oxidoreductase [Nitrococcus mobilis]EAR21653.1 probable oxidoreductase [Nitrococcus mobilis Nb-231]